MRLINKGVALSKTINKSDMSDEHTIEEDFINVGGGHKIWYQLWGNKSAKIPFIYFHGGPGSMVKPKHRYQFDPSKHLAIFFDQRGSGRSLSDDPRKNNTTWDLIDDAKNIIEKLGYSKVNVRGGSWGSTLSLLFAIENPKLAQNVVIDGTLLADKDSLRHWYDGTIKLVYPELWQRLLDETPVSNHDDPVTYHMQNIHSHKTTDKELIASTATMSNYEGNMMHLDDSFTFIDIDNLPEDYNPIPYSIFADYEVNSMYLEEGYILNSINKFKGLIKIIHGRFDMVCPMNDAVRLMEAAPNATLNTVIAGHIPIHETMTAIRMAIDSVSE